MSKREPSVLLDNIRISIEKIQRYTAGLDEASFLADEKTIDAVVRNLEIIGEVAKQLPAEFKNRHSAIPWLQIAGAALAVARLKFYLLTHTHDVRYSRRKSARQRTPGWEKTRRRSPPFPRSTMIPLPVVHASIDRSGDHSAEGSVNCGAWTRRS